MTSLQIPEPNPDLTSIASAQRGVRGATTTSTNRGLSASTGCARGAEPANHMCDIRPLVSAQVAVWPADRTDTLTE